MNRLPLLLLSIVSVISPSLLYTQELVEYSVQAEQIFSRSVELFKEGQFTNASAGFERVIKMFSPNQRTTAAYLMRAKSLLRLNEPLEAGRTLRNFISFHPSSSYMPDAEYTMGLVYLKIQRFDDAVQSFLVAWQSRADVSHTGFEALDRLIDAHVTTDAVHRLLAQAISPEERAFFWLKIGEKEADAERTTGVGAALDTLYRNYPGNPYRERIALLRARLEERSNVKIGILLSLLRKSEPSAVKELGNDIYEGIQLAVDEYSKNPSTLVKVTLETRDTERDLLVAARGIQELTSDNDIIGIIGPVFSNEALAVASMANRHGCPLVSPTANANGIAATGQYVFQANPDYETRGRSMARFAVKQKGFRMLAVLAPSNTFAKFMAEAFAAEAIRLGATIVATEWYERGASDLKGQMGTIRKAGLKAGAEPMISFAGRMDRGIVARFVELGVPMKRIDSLMNKSAVITAVALLGPEAKRIIDSLDITAVYDDPNVDSLEIPVTAIEGIYIPISSTEEIGIVSSQLVYYNIQAQVLGSGEWNNLKELDANKRYCSNVIFESDSYVAASDSVHERFVNAYFDRYRKRPSKNALLGYDTAAMVLSTVHGGGNSREAMRMGLQQVKNYQGLHAKINFSTKRVNTWLWILQYTGDIQLVDGFNVE